MTPTMNTVSMCAGNASDDGEVSIASCRQRRAHRDRCRLTGTCPALLANGGRLTRASFGRLGAFKKAYAVHLFYLGIAGIRTPMGREIKEYPKP